MLTVRKLSNGLFEADPGGPGSPICGHGLSVLEAVGDYAIQTGLVTIVTDPPVLVDTEYRIHPVINRAKLRLTGCPRRG